GHGDSTTVVELVEKKGAAPVPRHGLLGLYHFAILLPDRASLGAFIRHLGELGVGAGMADHLVSEAIYLSDPDGLGIEVYADRPRSTWRRQGAELAMATNPLDVDDLLAAAGAGPWTGMPAGTAIGHVHLHVGDLPAAERFYGTGLGFAVTVRSYPGALFLAAGGYHHHLGTNTWASRARPAADADARLLEWEIVVPTEADTTAVLDRLTALGAPAAQDGAEVVATDPWGVRVRIGTNG
ncbi:MAG TPA: VOC family protein, partial [Gemmatimonadales bacterium]|nr:VOC family protein [Gemmatimonadales bacterium]